MIVEGKDNLSEVIRTLKPFMDNNIFISFYSQIQPYLSQNVSSHFSEHISQCSILIYVTHGTLQTNNSYMPLSTYTKNILGIDNLFNLLYLSKLPDEVKNEIEIHWIICEKSKSIVKGVSLSILNPIDFLLERCDNNTVGRLNYINMEEVLLNTVGKKTIDSLFLHKNSKNLFSSLFNIFPSTKKAKYASKKDILNFNNFTRANKDHYTNLIYRPICPSCLTKKSIILEESKIEKKYKKPSEIIRYIRKNKKVYAELLCQSCRKIDEYKPYFIREIEKLPKTSQEKDMSFLSLYKQYFEAENNIANTLITDEIISILEKE